MLYLEWFKQATGTRITEVPYKGTPEQIDAMLRNDVQLLFLPALAIRSFIDNGRITPLFIVSKERLAALPNVPTNAEAGVPDYQPPQWAGVMSSSKVPDDVIQKIRADSAPVIGSPQMATLLANQGNRPFKGTSKEADELYDYTKKVLLDLGKSLNIKPE